MLLGMIGTIFISCLFRGSWLTPAGGSRGFRRGIHKVIISCAVRFCPRGAGELAWCAHHAVSFFGSRSQKHREYFVYFRAFWRWIPEKMQARRVPKPVCQRSKNLALTLLVLGVFANNHYAAMAFDNFALFAHGLHGRSYFHVVVPPFNTTCVYLLLHVMRPNVRS